VLGLLAGAAASQTAADPRAAAQRIDALVEQALADAQQQPLAIVDDATFLRRAYLAVIGRIPTVAEAERFLADRAADKRTKLVDELLQAPGRVSHEFNWWADLLRVRTRLNRQVSGEPFAHWLKTVIANNQPYDAVVRAMLTAEGPAHARGNGATGYLLRDLGMPLDNMANTLRVFTGTRLECAQCHNHPFDKWKQLDFYEMAAFTGGIRYRSGMEESEQGQRLRKMALDLVTEHGRQAQQAFRQVMEPVATGLAGSGTGLVRLPKDYKYPDAKPGTPVAAQTIFGAQVQLKTELPREPRRPQRQPPAAQRRGDPPVGREIDSRAAFAEWLTSPDNPRFAQTLANRQWQRLFGRGLLEPVDDVKDDAQAAIPGLLAHLTQLTVDLDFDVRELQRVLLYTQLFQRAVPAQEPPAETPYLFPGPVLRRLSAEQLWDSLLALIVPDVDRTLADPGARAEEVYRRYEKIVDATPEEIEREVEAMLLRYTDPQKYREQERQRRQQEAGKRLVEQAERQREARPLLRELALARRKNDEIEMARVAARLRELGVQVPGEQRLGGALLRASDLQQPAPPGHLLRELGQSDRETIEGGHREANVPQVLALLNGFVELQVLQNPTSALMQALAAPKIAAERVTRAFVTVLARKPDAKEKAQWTSALEKGGDGALRDLAWVLVNSQEFRFIR
jgi:hypothetical protein